MTPPGPSDERPSVMRSLGQFLGHIARGIRTNPAADSAREGDEGSRRIEVDRRVEEEDRDGVILRRTTIEEVELPARPRSGSGLDDDRDPSTGLAPDPPDSPDSPDSPGRPDPPHPPRP